MAKPINILTERQIQRAILQRVGACFPDVFIAHIPNGAHLAGDEKARSRQVGALLGDGMKPGMVDLIALWNGGGLLMEVKRPKTGRISPAQEAVHTRLSALGWPVSIVTSQDEASDALRAAGAPCVEAA